MTALAAQLDRGLPDVRRFLEIATSADRVDLGQVTAAGVPPYQARHLLQRLHLAEELVDHEWQPQALAAYRAALLATQPAAAQPRRETPEQPREKAQRLGIGQLSDSELIALILRTGSGEEDVREFAERLLHEFDGLIGLAGHDVAELIESHGMGPAKASEVASAFELGRRLAQARRRERPAMRTPEEVIEHLRADLPALRHEELWCLALDARSRLIGEPRVVSRGDVDGTEAGPRVFFRTALRAGAVSAIAVHNHPTGDAQPSAADRAVTQRLAQAGRLLDISLVDHLVVGDGLRFTSIRRTNPDLFSTQIS